MSGSARKGHWMGLSVAHGLAYAVRRMPGPDCSPLTHTAMNSPANQDPFFTRVILAILDKATTKGDLTMLISRHLVTAGGGLLAGHGILTGDTKQIVFGVGFAVIIAIWSWAVRVLHLDEQTMMSLTKSDLFRSAVAALASQAVTALSAALAVDADNPTLLVAALINLGLSKLDVHHKLAFVGARDAVRAFAVLGSLFSVCSCAELKDLAAANEPLIEEVIVYGVRTGVKAGIKKLDKPAAKQPRDVTPQAGILTPRLQLPRYRNTAAAHLALTAAN